MTFISAFITNYRNNKLNTLAKRSSEIMRDYSFDNVFRSKTINELLTDKFEYKGNKGCMTFVKDLETGKPVKLRIITSHKPDTRQGWTEEKIRLVDKQGREAGCKTYSILKRKNGQYLMNIGDMSSTNGLYAGVGFRLDQLQVERALQLGIDTIPRQSLPEAVYYHAKMGFLPRSSKLVEVKSVKKIRNLIKEYLGAYKNYVGQIEPIVVKKEDKFYLDLNKTIANLNLNVCKNILQDTGKRRPIHFYSRFAQLELKGRELDFWKQIIEQHPILSKLPFNLKHY